MEKQPFFKLLDRFISAEISDFIVSVPVKERSLLDDFPRFVFMASGELDCDIGKDGMIQKAHLPENSVLFGMQGASTGCSPQNTYEGETFTVGFFQEYIRFVYYSFRNGKTADFFYFHTSEPVCGAGIMALESLRNIALNPDMREARIPLMKAILEMAKVQLSGGENRKIGKSAITWKKVENYINQHLTEENLSRKMIAGEFRINECYLSSLCQLNTHHTLNNFILRKRLGYALLLLEQNKTVGEIADACGFRQTGYFIQVFRKIYGISPGKYRTRSFRKCPDPHIA